MNNTKLFILFLFLLAIVIGYLIYDKQNKTMTETLTIYPPGNIATLKFVKSPNRIEWKIYRSTYVKVILTNNQGGTLIRNFYNVPFEVEQTN